MKEESKHARGCHYLHVAGSRCSSDKMIPSNYDIYIYNYIYNEKIYIYIYMIMKYIYIYIHDYEVYIYNIKTYIYT